MKSIGAPPTRTKIKWFVILSVVACFSGCLTSIGDQFRRNGLTQAAFELGCPQNQVTTSYLVGKETDGTWSIPPVVGVEGCGKRATYTIYQYGGQWVRREKTVDTSAR